MNRTILVIEDEESLLLAIVERLTLAGFHVLGATNGEQALALAARQASIGLVISDLRMPGIGVEQMLKALRSDYPLLQVVFISAYYDQTQIRMLLEQPNTRFIRKPFSLTEIVSAVTQMLDAKQDTGAGGK